MRLRDGSVTNDKRLDRIVKFDERSKLFRILDLIFGKKKKEKKPRSYTWNCNAWLDQGKEGACVGFGIAHELCASPAEAKVNGKYAREKIYWEAQKIDRWQGGAYPGAKPIYHGTSVLAGVKVAHKLGWMDSYHWAFNLNDVVMGVGYKGPAVLGLPWKTGMYLPDNNGFIHARGKKVGGHCILCRGVNVKEEYFLLRNSWGKSWGMVGDCKLSFSDFEKLIPEYSEMVFFTGRHKTPKKRR